MTSYKVALTKGDGIGPEVIAEAVNVLNKATDLYGPDRFRIEYIPVDVGAAVWLKTGEPYPEDAKKKYEACDAILFGAIGKPDKDTVVPEKIVVKPLLEIRQGLEMYINLRECKHTPGVWSPLKDEVVVGADIIVVRENTEGTYTAFGGTVNDEAAVNTSVYTRKGVERIARYAFELARTRKKKLTNVDKSNVIPTDEFWRIIVNKIAEEYPDVELKNEYMDIFDYNKIVTPKSYDIVLADNQNGDTIADGLAVLAGGMGRLPSGNINPNGVSMFEPVHGTAPDIAGTDTADPIAAIGAARMMLQYGLNEKQIAKDIEKAVLNVCSDPKNQTKAVRGNLTTQQMGDLVVRELEKVYTRVK